MRRLAIAVMAMGALLGLGASGASAQDAPADPAVTVDGAAGLAPVDVFEVSGLVDDIVAEEISKAITRAETDDAQALILQLNSTQAVVSDERMVDPRRAAARRFGAGRSLGRSVRWPGPRPPRPTRARRSGVGHGTGGDSGTSVRRWS
ncbi:MAG: hypothetical protein R2715_12700 [Ilumatobacteraceae bacterium]